jgi:hypothetical protein
MADAPDTKLRWYRLTPDRLVLGLLAVEAFLLLSNWGGWFPFNRHKGWTVLMAVAAVGLTLLLMLLWLAAAPLFRCRFQYSLRSLLLLVVAVAVPCSWLATEMKLAREERAALAKVNGGPVIEFDCEFDDNGRVAQLLGPSAPPWLCRVFGDDFFSTANAVYWSDRGGTVYPEELQVPFDLSFIRHLGDVRSLDISFKRATDADMEYLEGMPYLEFLDLTRTRVTDAGLVHLRRLKRLKRLSLQCLDVTDAGLEHVRRLHELRQLLLGCPKVTDRGLASLKGLVRLRKLWVDGTMVTGSGLGALADLPDLEELSVCGTWITDASLSSIRRLKHLKWLGIFPDGDRVTQRGVDTLMASLPGCQLLYRFQAATPNGDRTKSPDPSPRSGQRPLKSQGL